MHTYEVVYINQAGIEVSDTMPAKDVNDACCKTYRLLDARKVI